MARQYSIKRQLPYKLLVAVLMLIASEFYLTSQASSPDESKPRAAALAQANRELRLFYGVYHDDPSVIRQATEDGQLSIGELNNAFEIAIFLGHVRGVAQLLKAGASLEHRTPHGSTPLITAASFAGNAPVVRQLLDAGADPNALTDDGQTALSEANSIGDQDSIKMLAEAIARNVKRHTRS